MDFLTCNQTGELFQAGCARSGLQACVLRGRANAWWQLPCVDEGKADRGSGAFFRSLAALNAVPQLRWVSDLNMAWCPCANRAHLRTPAPNASSTKKRSWFSFHIMSSSQELWFLRMRASSCRSCKGGRRLSLVRRRADLLQQTKKPLSPLAWTRDKDMVRNTAQ